LFGAEAEDVLRGVERVLVLACGTSYHAGLVARYWIEAIAGLPCDVRDSQRVPLSGSVFQTRARW
jgi:glucosamine--fructose-6-phosphate aminotransferase (isomerizing)